MTPAKRRLILPRRRWRYPAGIERDYQRILRAVARALAEATRQHIGIVNALLARRHDETESEYFLRLIRESYIATGTTERAIAQAARIAQQVNGYNRGEFIEVLRSALKVDIFAADPDLRRTVDEWTAENVRLIKSIPEEYFGKLQGIVSRGLQQGSLAADMGQEIEKLYGVTSRRAQMIARDQVATLNGLLSQERQMGAGIRFYQWSTSKDARVRESHSEREGRYYAWPGSGVAGQVFNGKVILPPPPDGPPGVPINCRCVALPVIDTEIAAAAGGVIGGGGQPPTMTLLPTPANIDADLPGVPQGRRSQLRADYDKAPEEMRRVIQRVAHDTSYLDVPPFVTSHYSLNNVLNISASEVGADFNRVFWHEAGHAVDHQIAQKLKTPYLLASSSSDIKNLSPFQKALARDVDKFRKLSYTEIGNLTPDAAARQKLRDKIVGAVSNADSTFYDHRAVSDIFSCATKNEIRGRWGHDDAYLNRGPQFPSAEVFANLWQVYFQNEEEAISFLGDVFPEAVTQFKKIIKKHGR